jgi:hypothetical protein
MAEHVSRLLKHLRLAEQTFIMFWYLQADDGQTWAQTEVGSGISLWKVTLVPLTLVEFLRLCASSGFHGSIAYGLFGVHVHVLVSRF